MKRCVLLTSFVTVFLLLGCVAYGQSPVSFGSILFAVSDTYVRGGDSNADTNFSDSKVLAVKLDRPNSHASLNRKTFVKFDVAEFDAPVSEAILRLYQTAGNPGIAVELAVIGITDEWSEDSVTWSNGPLTGGVEIGTYNAPGADNWFEVDVTEYVNAQIDAEIVSFRVESVTDHDKGDLRFHSSRSEVDYLHPQLYVKP